MKRAWFLLIVLSLVLVLGCPGKAPESRTSSAAISVTDSEVDVVITLKYTAGTPPQFEIDGNNLDYAYLSTKAGQVIRWLVDNKTAVEATVTIDGFRNLADISVRDPFGPNPSDNVFKAEAVKAGNMGASKQSNVPRADRYGSYKYSVKIELKGAATIVLDPRVVVGD